MDSASAGLPASATAAEIRAYNTGVTAAIDIARRSAAAISATSHRRVHEDFAVAALSEFAEAAKGLLLSRSGRDASISGEGT